jgi:HAD superfamily hydrolase (TIGR01509 family)
VHAAQATGLRRAVVSASANCGEILQAAGIADLFEAQVDGVVAAREHLRGKPAADMFLAAAGIVGARPGESAVFEDALAGVAAGRAGGFGFIVGVDRVGHADALRAHGADVVVSDLADLLGPA